jgi:hypothetical protein
MKSIVWGVGLGVALLGAVTTMAAAQAVDVSNVASAATDTTIAAPRGLELLQPGVPVRATYALCGDISRPVTELTGTFVELQEEGFEMEVTTGDRKLLHQVSLTDLLSIEVGTERSLTKRGTLIGALGGAALGAAGAAIEASGSEGDAEYAAGAAIVGLVGAGVGALLGSRSTTIEWQELPLYGEAYCK